MRQDQLSHIFFVVWQDHHDHQQDQHDKFDIATHHQSAMQQNLSILTKFHNHFEWLFNYNIFWWFSSIFSDQNLITITNSEFKNSECHDQLIDLTLVHKCYFFKWANVSATWFEISRFFLLNQNENHDCDWSDYVK